ncbi:MAG: BrnA antitoxin family protein [Niveispirillum sp.]|uniref:BrnA antitoxin family protein n=1 Tax=Niveispirillum sp. TaxID=1917217 RepID=UPI003BA5634B
MSANGASSSTTWTDLDDGPELTNAFFEPPDEYIGSHLVRRGRPSETREAREQVTLRLDADVLERFRADGPGWQTRTNAALRAAAGL